MNGRDCPVISGSKDAVELEKRLASIVLEGAPIVGIGNLSFDLESDFLCQMSTSRYLKPRVLGKSKTPECEWTRLVLIDGNNICLIGDLTRRVLICNLDREMERPERFKYGFDPIEKIRSNRGHYLAAAMIIAKAYRASPQYRQLGLEPFGSYEEWSPMVREPLVWLGLPDVIDSQEQARADDPKRSAAQELIAQWEELLGVVHSYKVTEIIARVSEEKEVDTDRINPLTGKRITKLVPKHSEFFGLLMEHVGLRGEIDSKKLGGWLTKLRKEVHNDCRIVCAEKDPKRGNRWKLQKRAGGTWPALRADAEQPAAGNAGATETDERPM